MSTTTRISEHRDYYHDDQENKEKENKEEKKKKTSDRKAADVVSFSSSFSSPLLRLRRSRFFSFSSETLSARIFFLV